MIGYATLYMVIYQDSPLSHIRYVKKDFSLWSHFVQTQNSRCVCYLLSQHQVGSINNFSTRLMTPLSPIDFFPPTTPSFLFPCQNFISTKLNSFPTTNLSLSCCLLELSISKFPSTIFDCFFSSQRSILLKTVCSKLF